MEHRIQRLWKNGLGLFWKTPCPSRPQIGKTNSKQLNLDPTTKNPREINDEDPNKGIATATEVLKANNLEVTDENIFIAASLKDKGVAFFETFCDYTIGVRKHDPNAEEQVEQSTPQNPLIMMFRLDPKSFRYILKMVVLSSMERAYDVKVDAVQDAGKVHK